MRRIVIFYLPSLAIKLIQLVTIRLMSGNEK
jgi:hypothetical protein